MHLGAINLSTYWPLCKVRVHGWRVLLRNAAQLALSVVMLHVLSAAAMASLKLAAKGTNCLAMGLQAPDTATRQGPVSHTIASTQQQQRNIWCQKCR